VPPPHRRRVRLVTDAAVAAGRAMRGAALSLSAMLPPRKPVTARRVHSGSGTGVRRPGTGVTPCDEMGMVAD
jgi:hypothetical protein